MDFYTKIEKMALGSRLRRLSETLTEQAGEVYALYGTELQPKWFPVFYALSDGGEKSIMQIAEEIGHSHPSVSTIVKEMTKYGVVAASLGSGDGRKNYIKLTEKGEDINQHIQAQYIDVNEAVEKAMAETQYNLWKAMEEWEFLLGQKSLLERVRVEKKLRESKAAQIVDYLPQYQADFRQLNVEWITTWFKMEEADYKSLDHPEEYILNKGGHIIFALYEGKPVGTCALIKMNDGGFELAKMAVSPTAKGKGIGFLLGKAIIESKSARRKKALPRK